VLRNAGSEMQMPLSYSIISRALISPSHYSIISQALISPSHYITLHRNYLKSPMVKKLLNDCPM